MNADDGARADVQVDSKGRRRAYMRTMMKIYRDEFKLEMAYLRGKEKQLEGDIRTIMARRHESMRAMNAPSLWTLPWREVATAFRETSDASFTERDALRRKTSEYHRIILDMQRWVNLQASISIPPNPRASTWRDTTLLEHSPSRELGKAWITEQMYHNIDRMFHRYNFPSTEAPCDLYDMEVLQSPDTDAFEFIHRRQFDINLPASFLLQMYRDIIGHLIIAEDYGPVVSEAGGRTLLHSTPPHAAADVERLHLLVGDFEDAANSRHVFVAQQVHHDPRFPSSPEHTRRNRSLWYEIQAISPTTSRLRCLFLYSQLIDSNGEAVPFHDEAKRWEFDAAPDASAALLQAKFRQHTRASGARMLSIAQRRVLEYVRRVRDEDRPTQNRDD